MPDEEKDTKPDSKIIEQAQERFKLCQEAETTLRTEAQDDLDFLVGDQWPENIKADRGLERPCHVIDLLSPKVRQITNAERQNRVSALVRPVDDKGDVLTADVIQGIIRHIERYSHAADASGAYDTAGFHAAAMGWGFWRIVSEYLDPRSFDQEICIKRIRNSFSVYLDPSSIEPDGSDADYAFITEQLSEEEFEQMYPGADKASLDDFMARGDGPKDWVQGNEIRVVEYIYKEKRKDTVLLVRDLNTQETRVILSSELPEKTDDFDPMAGLEILKQRETEICTVKWCKLNAVEILERKTLPGTYIPVIKVLGSELEVDGKLHLSGIVRPAKDAQRQYNYMASAETEAIALAPKAPVLGAEGQFDGHPEWADANRKNYAYLEYKPTTHVGQPVPPPTRLLAQPDIQAIVLARAQSADDVKVTTNVYDAQVGARANETSGRAIVARTQQGETSNYHYADNLRRSIEHSCRILVEWIPVIYDTPRAVRIIGEDDQEKIVLINQIFEQEGQNRKYDLAVGRYDVVTTSGPSFTSRRAQAAEQMAALAQAYPPLMQLAGDLLVENLDIPGAQKLANRLKKTLPPGLAEDDERQAIPPEAQMKLQQAGQMIEQLTQALNQANETIATKKLELDSRERIEMAKIQAQVAQTQAELDSKESIEFLKTEVENIKFQLGMNVDKEAKEASATAQQV